MDNKNKTLLLDGNTRGMKKFLEVLKKEKDMQLEKPLPPATKHKILLIPASRGEKSAVFVKIPPRNRKISRFLPFVTSNLPKPPDC